MRRIVYLFLRVNYFIMQLRKPGWVRLRIDKFQAPPPFYAFEKRHASAEDHRWIKSVISLTRPAFKSGVMTSAPPTCEMSLPCWRIIFCVKPAGSATNSALLSFFHGLRVNTNTCLPLNGHCSNPRACS